MQQLELENSDLGEPNFIGKRMTRANPQGYKILRTSGMVFFHELR
jgi:hypothetical protein